MPLCRAVYDLNGIVQGVGFRPAIYRLATRWSLTGSVINRSGTVRLVLEGTEAEVNGFLAALRKGDLPENARIDRLQCVAKQPIDPTTRAVDFAIGDSRADDLVHVVIPPDLKVCTDCLREIMDPTDRRYGYPFTTCTHCGPRYTVVERMPYDRERTTLSDFPMCAACQQEYEDPDDRRFHAESTACPACGPTLRFETADGSQVANPLVAARQALQRGDILAVRGIGGFLLAADGFNRETLQRLRRAKQRPHKPFAVMAPDIATLSDFCRVPEEARSLLTSAAAPIVILDVAPDAIARGRLPLDLISPDTRTLGAMLPTSPLHQLLFEPLQDDPLPRFSLLIMTSGNRGGEPICITNEEARDRLGGIADAFLLHDRRIKLRNDDSVCVLRGNKPQVWRRARGYAPGEVRLRRRLSAAVLGMGAELKNAIALGDEDRVVLSPHIGDLETPEALEGMRTVVRTLPDFLERTPDRVAVDLHPDMHSTRAGVELAHELGVPVVRVQHHHAHGAACMAEHGIDHALAVCFDGTGLGPDDTIWGAELLDIVLDADDHGERKGGIHPSDVLDRLDAAPGFRRLATFVPVPLPGGDAAVHQPVRQLIARCHAGGITVPAHVLAELGVSAGQADIWIRQCAQRINAPLTHSAGRLFDAFSALLGLHPGTVTYEGQAAIRLESAADRCREERLPSVPFTAREHDGMLRIDWANAFSAVDEIHELRSNADWWALAFHEAVARAAMTMIDYGLSMVQPEAVVLSGGVFMNRILSDRLVALCRKARVPVLLHRQSPPNDGCVALGQVVIAGM